MNFQAEKSINNMRFIFVTRLSLEIITQLNASTCDTKLHTAYLKK